MHPLFQQYPSLQGVLPCAGFASLPTPVSTLDSHGQAWVKHDDLTHPVYGGNKIRKLEFIIGEWRQRQVREVITFGAVGTNAGLATALACHQEGIRCRVLLFDQPVSATVRANLLAMQQLGTKLDYCGNLFQTALRFYLHPGACCRTTTSSLPDVPIRPQPTPISMPPVNLRRRLRRDCYPNRRK